MSTRMEGEEERYNAVFVGRGRVGEEYRVYTRLPMTLPTLACVTDGRLERMMPRDVPFSFDLDVAPDNPCLEYFPLRSMKMRVLVVNVKDHARKPCIFAGSLAVKGPEFRAALVRDAGDPMPWMRLTIEVLKQVAERYHKSTPLAFVDFFTTATDLGTPRASSTEEFLCAAFEQSCALHKEKCAICHEGRDLMALECEHEFHRACIEQWVRRNPTCPICRKPVRL